MFLKRKAFTAALLFAHLYVCKPMWFDGILRPYWPFIVMGIAFAGVGPFSPNVR